MKYLVVIAYRGVSAESIDQALGREHDEQGIWADEQVVRYYESDFERATALVETIKAKRVPGPVEFWVMEAER